MASSVFTVTQRINELLNQSEVLKGVEDQVGHVLETLRSTNSFLRDAESIQDYRVAEIRDLAHEAEDVIDTFVLKTTTSKIKRLTIQESRSKLENIISEMVTLMKGRNEIYSFNTFTDKKLIKSGDDDGEEAWRRRRRRRSSRNRKEDDHQYFRAVALDEHVEKLASVLVNDYGDQGRVVCIRGSSGVGKTTLAKMVYHHQTVRDHFDGHAWVFVSCQQRRQPRKIWENILDSLGYVGEAAGSEHYDRDLAEKLYFFLNDNKFLVVLDDVWDCDTIKAAFQSKGKTRSRSRILLTTRDGSLAGALQHDLYPLDEDQSSALFQDYLRRDFRGDEINSTMEELGRKMVRHCYGLPLAIGVLGGVLARKRSLAGWRMVHETLTRMELYYDDYFFSDQGRNVLDFAYDDLPFYLKPCLLYLSRLPEGYEISCNKLIQLWTTEGIVMQQRNEDEGEELNLIEDVAESYLIELVESCMIQVGEVDASFKIKTCYMHDLVRKLCLSKPYQENFFHIKSCLYEPSHLFDRRVAIHGYFDIQSFKAPYLRSLLFFSEIFPQELIDSVLGQSAEVYLRENKAWVSTVWLLCQVMREIRRILRYTFNNFKLLRVLDFEGADMFTEGGFLKDIDDLVHLKYLSLKNTTCVTKLPSSLGNLRWLQTLDLRMNEEFPVHVPDMIWRLDMLRHLYLPDACTDNTKLKLGNLRNLLILVNFNTRNCHLGDLHGLTNLRELSITRYFEVKQEDGGINLSLGIQSLFIGGPEPIDPAHITRLLSHCEKICELGLSAEIGKLPCSLPPSIAYMYLRDTKLDADPMPDLEKLPNLKVLELQNAFKADVKKIVCSAGGFPQLESLKLAGLLYLEEWEKDERTMPKLRKDSLQIINCKKLKRRGRLNLTTVGSSNKGVQGDPFPVITNPASTW